MQIYDVPVGFMLESVGKQLGNFLGVFVEYDPNNSSTIWRSYMRIKLNIDVRNPLKRFKKIKVPRGDWSLVKFQYERLGTFCFLCGILGHTDKFCGRREGCEEGEPAKEWGPWLRAQSRRGSGLGGEKWLREEAREDKENVMPVDGNLIGCERRSEGVPNDRGSLKSSSQGILRPRTGNNSLQISSVNPGMTIRRW